MEFFSVKIWGKLALTPTGLFGSVRRTEGEELWEELNRHLDFVGAIWTASVVFLNDGRTSIAELVTTADKAALAVGALGTAGARTDPADVEATAVCVRRTDPAYVEATTVGIRQTGLASTT
ncbi:hypothetical protein OUZ56_009689 [Daphnia magna]|uniref:Uncharacterized protein n=1 Tax=Daphnia magna TaxID=35525 RepID=A0ABR0AGR9_9CRUS|nr:hypothetical protein OUZ56_009689 [Daphnia magna]